VRGRTRCYDGRIKFNSLKHASVVRVQPHARIQPAHRFEPLFLEVCASDKTCVRNLTVKQSRVVRAPVAQTDQPETELTQCPPSRQTGRT
jgi:hypothetical protein